jgi:hypothetical protein
MRDGIPIPTARTSSSLASRTSSMASTSAPMTSCWSAPGAGRTAR